MARFKVTIKETLERDVYVTGIETAEEAYEKVEDLYNRELVVLDADDFGGADFSVKEIEKEEYDEAARNCRTLIHNGEDLMSAAVLTMFNSGVFKNRYSGIIEIYPRKAMNSIAFCEAMEELSKDYTITMITDDWIRAFRKR